MNPPVSPAPGSESRGYAAVIPAGSLTPRQREVLVSMAEGRSIRETAAHLRMGQQTVRTHMGEAYRRLGVHSLLAALWAMGWTTAPVARSAATWASETPHEWRVW